jgi:uncharacterized protein (DUF58 family)
VRHPAKAAHLPWHFPLRLTREGNWFCWGICLGIGAAAMNTGNNLLYLVFGMLLGLIVASGVLSEISLRRLDVRRHVPARIFAGRSFLMGIGLANRKRRFPSFSVEVEDLIEGRTLEKRCFFLKVPAGRAQQTSYRHQFVRRGLYRLTGFRVSTKFPFALFRKSRDVRAAAEVVVLPALVPIATGDAPEWWRAGEDPSGRRGRGGEFMGLRPFQDGDDARDIHWRASAHTGRLVVREHEDEQQRTVVLALDNAAPAGAPADARDDAALERAIGLCASFAMHYGTRGLSVGFAARGVVVPPLAGEPHVTRILRALALLGYAAADAPPPAVPPSAHRVQVRRGLPAGAAAVAR